MSFTSDLQAQLRALSEGRTPMSSTHDWRDAARERFDAQRRIPRCGDCRSLSAAGTCRHLSSIRCARDRSVNDAACPWWGDADDRKPLPPVHAEQQIGERNYPRGMEYRVAWGG